MIPQIEDDWEEPEEFWQILSLGGYVTNVDNEGRDEILHGAINPVNVVDIYGDEVYLYRENISGVKQWTKKGGDRWRKTHKDDEQNYDSN